MEVLEATIMNCLFPGFNSIIMKRIVIYLFLATYVLSCNSYHRNQEFNKISIQDCAARNLSFVSYKVVKLETDKENLLGSNILIKLFNNEIFVMDVRNEKCVMRFNQEGKFINKIGSIGSGPEEYLNILDFSVSKDTISILSGLGSKSQISVYLPDGKFIRDFDFELAANSLEKISDGYIVNTSYTANQYRFYSIDNTGKIEQELLKNYPKFFLPVLDHNFMREGSTVYITEAFNNSVYAYSNGKFSKTYELDLSPYTIPKEFYEMDLMTGFQMINRDGFAQIRKYVENKRFTLFEIAFQKEGEKDYVQQILIDRKKNIFYRKEFEASNNIDDPLAFLVTITEDNELVYYIYPSEILEFPEKYKSILKEQDFQPGSFSEIDNPVLVFCKFNYED